MLSRAALPLLRPSSLRVASRVALLNAQTRGLRNDKGRLGRREDYKVPDTADFSSQTHADRTANQPRPKESLRSVRISPSEKIDPQASETETSSERTRASSTTSESTQNAAQESSQSESTQPLPDLRDGQPSDFTPEEEQRNTLPDLTKGIPSTFDAELEQSQRSTRASQDSLNITEDPEEKQTSGGGGRGGDGLPRDAYVSSSDRRRAKIVRYVYLSLGVGGLAYVLYLGRNWENEDEKQQHAEVADGYSPGLIYRRAMARLGSAMSYYRDPVTRKLLPDEDPNPDLRAPFTLVISLEDMLVHSEWSRDHGWRVAKRPGIDYFLKYLSQYYEIVLFTSQPSFSVDQILRKLDPFQMIRYPLFREATLYKDGGYVKDLSYLNRDLKKVIIMDTEAHHVKHQPENAILLPKWKGDPSDKGLIDFIPFLEYLANMGFDDAREVLKSFEGKNIPQEFDRRQKVIRDKWEAQQANKKRPKRSISSIGSIFGTKPQQADGMQSLDEAAAEGKMIWDQIRERGQKNYLAMEQRIQEEGAKWLAEREAEEKKLQEEAMANMKSGVFSWFGGSSKGS